MSFEKVQCVLVRCDGCGELFNESGDYVVHYDSEQEAEQGVKDNSGFTVDGKHYCESCNAEGRIPGGVRCSCDQAEPRTVGLGTIKRDANGHRLWCAVAEEAALKSHGGSGNPE